MPDALPAPEVARCYLDGDFDPPLPALALRWDADAAGEERVWDLPEDVSVLGPPPRRFGITVRRRAADSYDVRLRWDGTAFRWDALTRTQLLTSSLLPLLEALGTDLWYLLDQPLGGSPSVPDRAA
jgi:hypothetical protein